MMLRNRRWTLLPLMLATAGLAACDDDDDPIQPISPPSAPVISSAVVGDDGVVLTWAAATGATRYDVQRQPAGSTTFTAIANDLTATTYTDASVEPGAYSYRIVAEGEGGSTNGDPVLVTIEEELPAVGTISGTISAARTLYADTTYTLRGIVTVDDGAVLTVQPGTLILGDVTVQPSALIVRQGGQLVAEGTAEAPIVFTSSNPAGSRRRGDWGGVVLNGRSICNFPAEDCIGEGSSGQYGGTQLNDDSGALRYVRIEYAGYEVSFGNELNALTLNGVGSGTEISYVQTHYGSDDGFEWFGGTVDAKYLLATGISDDSFDFSTGWQGRGQFWIAQQDPNDADNGYEVDGNEDDVNATPFTNPTVYNVTLVGKEGGTGGTAGESTTGMLLRLGTAGTYANHIVMGFGTAGIDIDSQESAQRVDVMSTIVFGNAVPFSTDNDGIDEQAVVTSHSNVLVGVDPQLQAPFNRSAPDFRPATGSPAVTAGNAATPPNDGWFDTSATFIGAIGAGATEWYEGWTTFAQN